MGLQAAGGSLASQSASASVHLCREALSLSIALSVDSLCCGILHSRPETLSASLACGW